MDFSISITKIIIIYAMLTNIISFAMFYIDKQRAKKHKWRISETALLTSAVIGGSLGAFSAMKLFRHKTKHPKFYITVPIFLIIHILIIVILILI